MNIIQYHTCNSFELKEKMEGKNITRYNNKNELLCSTFTGKKRRGKYIATHRDGGTPQLALAGTESEMPVHGLLEKLSAILQIRTSWKSQSKTDLAMERKNLQLPPTVFVRLALD